MDEESRAGRRPLAIRLYVEADLAADARVWLGRAPAHYLRHVMRLASGESIALFNGRAGEWRGEIVAYAKAGAELRVVERLRPQGDEPDLWLLFAPIKRQPIDLLAEKASELGVSRLWPVMTERTVVGRVNIDRLAAHAREAAEQSERLTVAEVRPPERLESILAGWEPTRPILLCAEAGAARPIAEILMDLARAPGPRACAILVGPEGGFAKGELDRLTKLPFVSAVGLGPRLLRADTAALAALACFQAIAGDGARRPPLRTFDPSAV